jgi:hypothetical protein
VSVRQLPTLHAMIVSQHDRRQVSTLYNHCVGGWLCLQADYPGACHVLRSPC